VEIKDLQNKIQDVLNEFSEKNYIQFERGKNHLFTNFYSPQSSPEEFELWCNRVDRENQRSLSLPYEKSRQYAHAAIFSLEPRLLRSAMLNHTVTSKEADLISELPAYRELRGIEKQSMQELLRQIRNNADKKAKRYGANQYRVVDDKFFSNHMFCPQIWEQMVKIFSQPNNQGALEMLEMATSQDAMPVKFKALRKLRELKAAKSTNIGSKMGTFYLAMKKSKSL